jgi:hypothetical protein
MTGVAGIGLVLAVMLWMRRTTEVAMVAASAE